MFSKKLFVVERSNSDGKEKWFEACSKIDQLGPQHGERVGIYELKELKTASVIPELK